MSPLLEARLIMSRLRRVELRDEVARMQATLARTRELIAQLRDVKSPLDEQSLLGRRPASGGTPAAGTTERPEGG